MHSVFLTQHTETGAFYVKKVLDVYNIEVYTYLMSHPHSGIPRIFEMFEDNARLTIIEEYITGTPLSALLQTQGTLPEETALRYLCALCDILSFLHCAEVPIVHRDIKPSNLIITPDGALKLLDFNAARLASPAVPVPSRTSEEAFVSHKTEDTVLLGTKGYAAPEQYGFGTSAPQTDIYALGVLFNEMLTGHLPAEQLASGKPARIIRRCTQLDPNRRYHSVTDLQRALQRLASSSSADLPVNAPSHRFPYAPPGFRNLKPWHIILSLIGYWMILDFALTSDFEATSPIILWTDRICFAVGMICMVLLSCNYLNNRVGGGFK